MKKKRRPRFKKGKLLGSIVIMLGIALIGFTVINSIKSQIDSWLVQVDVLEAGQITMTIPMEGLVIRNETVIYTPASGELELGIAEGQRVSVGSNIGKINGGYDTQFAARNQHTMSAPVAGLISLQLDGLETLLNSDSYKTFDLAKLPNGGVQEPILAGMVEKGQPIAKIINNLRPMGLLVPFANMEHASVEIIKSLEPGQVLQFKWGDSSVQLLSTKLLETKINQDQGVLILQIDGFMEELLNMRHIQLELVIEQYRGLLVNQQAIVYEYEEPGLLTIEKNDSVKWQPVEIVGQIDDQLAITGLKQGVKYVKNPSR